jgi:predicted RNA-binding protein YlxR (DUF448 family)
MIVIATHGRGMWVMDANPVNEKDKRNRTRQQAETAEDME